jgi:hypothetical protein
MDSIFDRPFAVQKSNCEFHIMKKHILTFFLAFTGLCYAVLAQVPNGGFETWTGNDPEGWVTTNGLMMLGNPQSVFKSTDPHSGSFACEINTVHVTNKPPGVFVPDYTGSVFTGKQVFVTSYFGFPCTVKPGKLAFWYKYNARNNDTASVLAYTTKWNSALNKRDTLAIAVGFLTDSVGTYVQHEIMFMVLDSVSTPDSAVVLFASSSISASQTGAKLILDDIEFTGGTVGVRETGVPVFSLFPNPVDENFVQLQFEQPEPCIEVTLFDLNGKVVSVQAGDAVSGLFTFHTNAPARGIYILSVETESGNAVKRLVIQ